MAKEHILINDPMDPNRIKKTIKGLILEASADRKLAKEAFDFFKTRVENNAEDNQSKELMTECLKLMQTARASSVKCMDTLVKLESVTGKSTGEGHVDFFGK